MMRISILSAVSAAPVDGFQTAEIGDEVLQRARKRSWYWPEAAWPSATALALEVAPNRSSVIAAANKVSELLSTLPGAVILVEPAELLHSAASWREQVEDASEEDFPVALFVAFVGKENEDKSFDLRSEGLSQFSIPEVEVEKSPRDGEFTLEAVCDAALLLVTAETLPADGDTVELSAGTFRVRTMPSLSGSGQMAYRMRIR